MVLLLFLFSSIYLKLFCVNGFLHFSPLSSCLCFLHLQYVCWVLHDSLRHGFQCLLCRWNLPFRLQTFFSDVILICHHQPDLVDEVVGDVGSFDLDRGSFEVDRGPFDVGGSSWRGCWRCWRLCWTRSSPGRGGQQRRGDSSQDPGDDEHQKNSRPSKKYVQFYYY